LSSTPQSGTEPAEERSRPLQRPWVWLLALGAILALLVALVLAAGPLPPRTITITTGPPGSDYALMGTQYARVLKHSGVNVRLLASAGSGENLTRLNDPRSGVQVGFAQGGLTDEAHSPDLESLGTIAYEPFWFFMRQDLPGNTLAEALSGRKIAIGPAGSGSQALATKFLEMYSVEPGTLQLSALNAQDAAAAIEHGDIDAAAMIASWNSESLQRLLHNPKIRLAGFTRADAYVALLPYLNKLVLPAGVISLADNLPPADVNLLAPKASLIIRGELHPAIQYLLLEAAAEVNSAPNIFQRPGQFPAAEAVDLPLATDARQFYKSGPPFLQRNLPFWLAVFAARFLLLLIPAVGILYPLLRLAPAAYGWSMRRRIFRLYGELKFIESSAEDAPDAAVVAALRRLRNLEERASHMRVPSGFSHFLYQLQAHIALVAGRLESRRAATLGAAPPP
jgi:TRAP-type uncharacterized transport system substrate-binding protein